MRFPNDKLQLALNFDTYADSFLTHTERMAIHRAISYKINYGVEFNLPAQLSVKIYEVLETIKSISYQPKKAMWNEEKDIPGIRRLKYV